MRPRRQGFAAADFKELLTHLPPDVADGTQFAYHSAWRRSMVWGARWMQCDLDFSEDGREIIGARIRLPREVVKNKRPHGIPLTGRLLEITAGGPPACSSATR